MVNPINREYLPPTGKLESSQTSSEEEQANLEIEALGRIVSMLFFSYGIDATSKLSQLAETFCQQLTNPNPNAIKKDISSFLKYLNEQCVSHGLPPYFNEDFTYAQNETQFKENYADLLMIFLKSAQKLLPQAKVLESKLEEIIENPNIFNQRNLNHIVSEINEEISEYQQKNQVPIESFPKFPDNA